MTHSADNQLPERPLSEVGTRAWGLASSRIDAARGLRIFRSPFRPLARTASARYLMRWFDARPADLTLLRRLPEPDAERAFAPFDDPEAMPERGQIARRTPPDRLGERAQPTRRDADATDAAPARQALVRPDPGAPQRLRRAAAADTSAEVARAAEYAALPKARPAQPGAAASERGEMANTAFSEPSRSPVLGAAPTPLPLLMRAPAPGAAAPGDAVTLADMGSTPAPAVRTRRASHVHPAREPSPPSADAGTAPAELAPPSLPRVAPAPPVSRPAAQDMAEADAPALPFLAPLLRPAAFASEVAGATGAAPRGPLPLVMRAPAEPAALRAATGFSPERAAAATLASTARLQPLREPAAPAAIVPGGAGGASQDGAAQRPRATAQRPGGSTGAAPNGEAAPALPRVALPAVDAPGVPAADAGPSLPFLAPILRRATFALDPAELSGADDEAPHVAGAPSFTGDPAPRASAAARLPDRATTRDGAPLVQPRRLAPEQLAAMPNAQRVTSATPEAEPLRGAARPAARPGALGSAAAATAATLARRLDPAPALADAAPGPGATAATAATTLARRLEPATARADGQTAGWENATAPASAALARGLGPAQRPGGPAAPATNASVQLARAFAPLAPARLPQSAQSADDADDAAKPFAAHAASTFLEPQPELPRVAPRSAASGSTLPLLQRSLAPVPLDTASTDAHAPAGAWNGGWPAPGSLSGPGGRGQLQPGTLAGRADQGQAVLVAPSTELLRPIAPVQRLPDLPAIGATASSVAGAVSSGAGAVDSAAAALGGALTGSAQQAQPAAEPDIDAIAQKVYEQLRRRLRIDQERLGKY